MKLTNAMQLVAHVENTLGWLPTGKGTVWSQRALEAAKIKRKMGENPTLYSYGNIALAVEYLRRKRQPVASPVAALFYVEAALEHHHAAPVRPLGAQIDEAIRDELARPDAVSSSWVSRLTRVVGTARQQMYDEWLAERGAR